MRLGLSLVRWYFGVLVRADAWLRVLWLALAGPLGLAWFLYLVVGLSVGAGLAITIVGVPLLVVVLFGTRLFGVLEGQLARALLRTEVRPAAWRPAGQGFWSRVGGLFTDTLTWRALFFGLLRFPVGLVAFVGLTVVGALSAALVTVPLFFRGTTVEMFNHRVTAWPEALGCCLAGLVLLPLALHLLDAVARGLGWACKGLLSGPVALVPGPSPTAQAAPIA